MMTRQLLFLGKDVLAKAKTGTGKTVAFLVSKRLQYFVCLVHLYCWFSV